jgi:hypothetical protein
MIIKKLVTKQKSELERVSNVLRPVLLLDRRQWDWSGIHPSLFRTGSEAPPWIGSELSGAPKALEHTTHPVVARRCEAEYLGI